MFLERDCRGKLCLSCNQEVEKFINLLADLLHNFNFSFLGNSMVNMGDCLIFFLLQLCVLGICNVMPFDIPRFSLWYLIFPLFIIDLVVLVHILNF